MRTSAAARVRPTLAWWDRRCRGQQGVTAPPCSVFSRPLVNCCSERTLNCFDDFTLSTVVAFITPDQLQSASQPPHALNACVYWAITEMQAGGSHLRNATCRSARSMSCVGRMPPSPGSMSRPITCTRNSNSCSLLIGIEPLGVSCTTKQHRQVTQVSGHARSRWRSKLFTRLIRWHACVQCCSVRRSSPPMKRSRRQACLGWE